MALIGTKKPKTDAMTGGTAAPKPAKAKSYAAPAKAKSTGGVFLGLDIGTYSIKAVEVKGFKSGLTVTGFGEIPTPPGTIASGIVGDPKALGAAIKQLLQKSGIKARRAVTAAAGAEGVVVRVIEVAAMNPTELKEMMKYEVERHIPFAASDVEISYQKLDDAVVGPASDETMMDVLLAVARRDMVGLHLNTLDAAGVTPVAIDVEPLAVGRSLIDLSKQNLVAKNVVVVNIGATITDVGVYKNGVLRFPRTIPIAGENFTRAISDTLGIPFEQAEEEKVRNGAVLVELLGQSGGDNPFADPAPGGASPFDFDFGDSVGGPPPAAPAPAGGGFNPFTVGDANTSSPAPAPGGFNPSTVGEENAAPVTPVAAFDAFGNPIDPNDPFAQPVTPANPTAAASDNPFDNPFDDPYNNTTSTAPVTETVTPVEIVADDPAQRRRRELFDALLPVLSEFAMEVRRSVDYFRSRYPDESIDQVILCGGGARLGNLNQYIEYEMGVPTITGDPLGNVLVANKNASAGRMSDVSPSYAVALGLAARDAVVGL